MAPFLSLQQTRRLQYQGRFRTYTVNSPGLVYQARNICLPASLTAQAIRFNWLRVDEVTLTLTNLDG